MSDPTLDLFRFAVWAFLAEHTDERTAQLCNRFAVSRATVNRWRTGANAPHPAMREPVFRWLLDKCMRTPEEAWWCRADGTGHSIYCPVKYATEALALAAPPPPKETP